MIFAAARRLMPRSLTAGKALFSVCAFSFFAGLPLSVQAFDLNSDLPIKVSADNARLDDSEGTATYSGAVEMSQGDTRLTADRVVLYRKDGNVTRVEASGSPARYQQPSAGNVRETRASANQIFWSASENLLTFEGNADIQQGGNRFRGQTILYDSANRVVTAEGGTRTETDGGRVEMIIQPNARD